MEDPLHFRPSRKIRITMPADGDLIVEDPGEGWETAVELARRLSKAQSSIDRLINRYQDKIESHRGFIRNKYDKRHWVTYYRLKKGEWEDFFKADHPGKGWKSVKEIAWELNRHVAIIERIIFVAKRDNQLDNYRGFNLDHNGIKHFTTYYRIKDKKKKWIDFYVTRKLGKEWKTISEIWVIIKNYSRSHLSKKVNEALHKGEVEAKHFHTMDCNNDKHFTICYRLVNGGRWEDFLKMKVYHYRDGWKRTKDLIVETGFSLTTLHRIMEPYIEKGSIEVGNGIITNLRNQKAMTTYYKARKGFRWSVLHKKTGP